VVQGTLKAHLQKPAGLLIIVVYGYALLLQLKVHLF
jgi:hypothetical protein